VLERAWIRWSAILLVGCLAQARTEVLRVRRGVHSYLWKQHERALRTGPSRLLRLRTSALYIVMGSYGHPALCRLPRRPPPRRLLPCKAKLQAAPMVARSTTDRQSCKPISLPIYVLSRRPQAICARTHRCQQLRDTCAIWPRPQICPNASRRRAIARSHVFPRSPMIQRSLRYHQDGSSPSQRLLQGPAIPALTSEVRSPLVISAARHHAQRTRRGRASPSCLARQTGRHTSLVEARLACLPA